MNHNKSASGCELDEGQEETIVEKLTKVGCLELHYKVQDCFFDKKDWRQCQVEIKEFKKCLDENKKRDAVKNKVQ
jgi:cytochrome c oxidase assembly factor 4